MLPKAVCSERPTHLNCCPKHTHTRRRRRRRSSEAQEFFPGRASQGSLYLLPIEFPGTTQEEEEEEEDRRSEAQEYCPRSADTAPYTKHSKTHYAPFLPLPEKPSFHSLAAVVN
jgi:hypothetical protein